MSHIGTGWERWLGLVAVGAVTGILGFAAGYLSRPNLDPDYIQRRYDPIHFGEYFFCKDKGWIIIEDYVINATPEWYDPE